MAENIGTLFSEIVIDGKRFTAQLQAIGKEGEKAGKDLGENISKGANKAISSLEQMKTVAMQLAYRLAAVYSIHQLSSFIKETALAAARFETLGVVMTQVAKISKVSTDVIKEQELALRKQGISMTETRSNLTKMMQAQIDTAKASKLARIAQDAAVIGDINSSEAFARMIHGIKSGQTEILRNIGLQVSNEAAYKNLAKSLKITTGQLTENQKMQARVNAVLEEGAKIVGVYEAAMSTAGKKLNSFTRYVQDFKVMMGDAFGPAMVIIIDSATESMKKLQKQISSPEAQQALKSLAIDFSKFIKIIIEKTPEAVLALTKLLAQIAKFYEASSGDALVYAGIGIVAFKLFGATPIGQFAAGVFLVAAAVSQLRFEIDKLFGGTKVDNKNFSNIMGVISGKRDWNTGESLISSASPGGLSSHESWRLGEGRYDSYDKNEMRRLGLIKPEIIKDKEKIELTKEQLKAIQAIESQYYSQAKFRDPNYEKWQTDLNKKERKEHLEKGVSKLIADKIYEQKSLTLAKESFVYKKTLADNYQSDMKAISDEIIIEQKYDHHMSLESFNTYQNSKIVAQKGYQSEWEAINWEMMSDEQKRQMMTGQTEKTLLADRLNLYKELISNQKKYGQEQYDTNVALYELQYEEYKEMIDKMNQITPGHKQQLLVAAQENKAQKIIDENRKMALSGNDLFAGMKIGFEQWGEQAETTSQGMARVTGQVLTNMTNALTEFVKTGKMNWRSLADSIIQELIRIQIQQEILYITSLGEKGNGSWIGSALSIAGSLFGGGTSVGTGMGGVSDSMGYGLSFIAKGNAFNEGKITPFAKGDVFNQPTFFPMASGMGLMGEDGPEAVMPLTRGSNGKLGVGVIGRDDIASSRMKATNKKDNNSIEGATNIFIQAVDAKSFEDLCKRNPAAITGPILQSLRDNKTRTEFKRLVN